MQGRYETIGKIGTGGMADVYKAKDHKLNRYVAIKVLKPEFREDKEFITKFRAEAQAAAGLAHPNIVNVYDVGEERGMHFIVMELVEGITLKEYITKKGRLAVREATSIAIQISQGLETAHNSGIIHRDVKPQNVIISTDGKVKVTDFGIARAATSNTITTTVMGSVHYTSPEQARGGYSDAKGDIYSLGITLYEMLTGHLPFDGDTTVAVAIKHLQEEMTAPDVYVPDLPKSTIQIINKCTQKSPDRRYANMTELIRDLKESLVNPDGDFVRIANSAMASGRTVVISKEELGAIKEGYNAGRSQEMAKQQQDNNGYAGNVVYNPTQQVFNANNPYNKPNNEQQAQEKGNYEPYAFGIDTSAYGKYGYQEEAFDPNRAIEEEDDDDDEDESGISKKLEKLMTVGSVIIGILIALIFVGLIVNALGLVKFSVGGIKLPEQITSVFNKDTKKPAAKDPAEKKDQHQTTEQTKTEQEQIPSEGDSSGIVIETDAFVPQTEESAVIIETEKEEVEIPDTTGLDYYSALDQLMSAGFYVSRQDEPSEIFPEGTVITQSMLGSARPGITIILSVSTGSERVSGLWSCDARLTAPPDYNGEPVRLILEHGNTTVTLVDGEPVEFPYDLEYADTEAVETGTVYMYVYDEMMGDYVLNVAYQDVPFEQG